MTFKNILTIYFICPLDEEYLITNLSPEKEYQIQVHAMNAVGLGAPIDLKEKTKMSGT